MTDELLEIQDLETFVSFFKNYEQNLGEILETSTIQKELFPDFNGLIKSLGGWGGDFVMVASEQNPREYFKQKGYNIIIPYSDMIL